jgi:hypothetical protein
MKAEMLPSAAEVRTVPITNFSPNFEAFIYEELNPLNPELYPIC